MSYSRKNCSSSCSNCRLKKRKCDGEEVCGNCKKLGLQCERPRKDKRTRRPTYAEIEKLRAQASNLEATLAKMRELVSSNNDPQVLGKVKELLHSSSQSIQSQKLNKRLLVSIDAAGGGGFGREFSVFGPTSAFHNLMGMSTDSDPVELFDNGLMNSSSLLLCLKNFFKYLYPDVTVFIHRESFLLDFLTSNGTQGYCSEELVYAIAALGGKASKTESLRALSKSFYETARDKILNKRLFRPSINTLQALLCLSLYELGDGNASASWMFSGMAIRMGYDLGFQLNPRDLDLDESSENFSQQVAMTNVNITVRSRIYWGCYILDHFISLIMGRPVTVRKTEASIPSSEVLPNATDIDEFVFRPPNPASAYTNLDAFQTIEPLCSLSECIGSLLTEIYSAESADDSPAYLNRLKLEEYNMYLAEWRQHLPAIMRWTEASVVKQDYNPTSANYKLFYYILLICLNRPFLNIQEGFSPPLSPHEICNTAISELAACLSKFNESGLPSSILIVYSSILALSVILMQLQNVPKQEKVQPQKISELKIFHFTLSHACSNWKLAAKSLLFIQKRVEKIPNPEVSDLFGSFSDRKEIKLSQSEFEQILQLDESMPDWAYQDNIFANFFDFTEAQ